MNFIFGYIIFFIQILILKIYSVFVFDALNNRLICIHVFLILFYLLQNLFVVQNVLFSISSNIILCVNLKILLVCISINLCK